MAVFSQVRVTSGDFCRQPVRCRCLRTNPESHAKSRTLVLMRQYTIPNQEFSWLIIQQNSVSSYKSHRPSSHTNFEGLCCPNQTTKNKIPL